MTTAASSVVLIGGTGGLSRVVLDTLHENDRPATAVSDVASLAEQSTATWIYVAGERGDRWGLPDLEDARRVSDAATSGSCRRLVVLSSSAVHEPSAHHPGQLDEARTAPVRSHNPIAKRWADLEDELCRHTSMQLTVHLLRLAPCPTADGCDLASRLLRGLVTLTPFGFDPVFQLLDPRDAIRAIEAAIDGKLDGPKDHDDAHGPTVHHVAPREVVPLRHALRRGRVVRLPIPGLLQALVRRLLAPLGWMLPPAHLDYLRYPFTISGEAFTHALGPPTAHSSNTTLMRLRNTEHAGANQAEAGKPGTERASAQEANRSRSSNDAAFDAFGLDRDYVRRLGNTLFRFLHDVYWRVEHRGLEHVPREGPAVLAGFHRGFMPWDGVMAMHLIDRRHRRQLRFLVHPTLIRHPVLTPYITRLGGVPACRENADWVLARGNLLGIFPEGIQGAFVAYRDAYTLGRFGRADYVKMALRNRAPIVPFVTVGHAEIFPILGKIDWAWWRKHVEWPTFPITPTMGLVPLPSKWHTLFLEPLDVASEHPPEAADDPAVVRAINREVRARMRAGIQSMLERRRSIWYGSVFDDANADGAVAA